MSQTTTPQQDPHPDDVEEYNEQEHGQPQSLDRIKRFIEYLYNRKISQEFDRIIPVVADEGMGKSTFMNQFTWLWQLQLGQQPTPDSVLDRVVWGDRDDFQNAMSEYPPQSCIPIQDGARVLHKKEAMHGEQIEIEKDLLDVRMKAFVIPIGFQDWDVVPDMLQRRRAKNLFRIPRRGVVYGYNRKSITKKYETGDWPEPDLRDTFPSLEGTDLWAEFKRRDREQKEKRMQSGDDETDSPDELQPREVVKEILSQDELDTYLGNNNGQRYIDRDLIRYHYPDLTESEAGVVKKGLLQEGDVDAM